MINNSNKIKILLLIFLMFLLSGCSLSEVKSTLRTWDDKAGYFFEKFSEIDKEEITDFVKDKEDGSIKFEELTREQKIKIDEWLENNGFNRYGDPEGTMYTGGTPLFDEMTGESIDRYNYIVDKIPGVVDKIKDLNNKF